MKRFKKGDILTFDEVKSSLKEAHDNNIKHNLTEGIDIQSHLSKDGFYEFESWEEYKKVFGDFVSVEETFK